MKDKLEIKKGVKMTQITKVEFYTNKLDAMKINGASPEIIKATEVLIARLKLNKFSK
jgi:hypothetical protein